MKKFLCLMALVMFTLTATGCGSDKQINGTWYETKGLATLDDKHPCVHYSFIVGNLVWSSIILSKTLVAPVSFIGWSLYEPVGEKTKGCFANQTK